MKKRIFLAAAFSVAYAVVFSIGAECLLRLLGIAFAITLDGSSVVRQYPRFIPFCVILGLLALGGLCILLIFSYSRSERYGFTKRIWSAQILSALVLSLPMIKLWEMVFDLLQKTF